MSMIELEDKYTIDCTLEACEPDIALVLAINKAKPETLWTVVEGDDSNLYAIAGYHLVNRLHYVVTLEEWSDDGEQYLWCEFEEDDDDG